MSKFIFFHNTDKTSIKIIKLITKFKLQNLFDFIQITTNNSHIYHKYLQTIPLLITNNSNITNYNTIIEFIIRLRLRSPTNKIIPYSEPLSLYNNLYSKMDESATNDNSPIEYYTPNYHHYDSSIPIIITQTETGSLNITDFQNKYNTLLKTRNA